MRVPTETVGPAMQFAGPERLPECLLSTSPDRPTRRNRRSRVEHWQHSELRLPGPLRGELPQTSLAPVSGRVPTREGHKSYYQTSLPSDGRGSLLAELRRMLRSLRAELTGLRIVTATSAVSTRLTFLDRTLPPMASSGAQTKSSMLTSIMAKDSQIQLSEPGAALVSRVRRLSLHAGRWTSWRLSAGRQNESQARCTH